jgi:hypothetical protein
LLNTYYQILVPAADRLLCCRFLSKKHLVAASCLQAGLSAAEIEHGDGGRAIRNLNNLTG